ncbi:hypothetical protein [Pedobacter miscanthi]|nr:hypothetical protein [Pedobacter miscanthi]
MIAVILDTTHAANFKDGIYLGLAIGAAIVLFLLSRKYRRKG